MKKILYILPFLLLFFIRAHAQDVTPGYYRVMNVGLLSNGGTVRGKTVKEECYAYVANGSYHVQMGSGAKQNIESMQLWTGIDNAILSPQTVVYIAKSGSNYTLEAQGTSVSQMTSYEIKVGQVANTTDTYTLTTTVSGIQASLWVDKTKTGVYSFDGVYDIKTPSHYKATTTSQGAEAYRQWKIIPISSSSDNYVAVNASLKAGDKYYAPYYASYPFRLVSSGMKVYYVNSITDTKYTLKEITDDVIPAATPVIIECESNNPADCKIEPLRGNYGSISGNKLKGVYFCNLSMSPKEYSDARTEFKAASMRVWAVKNDQLVLTNSTDRTIELALSGFSGYWLRANESYLANVPSTASADLVSAGAATTISFDSNGGSAVDPISGVAGDPVTAPEDPTKTGYSFAGWNPELPDVFPDKDQTLTAQWKINQYTITFNTNGGTAIPAITQDYNTAITKPSDPTRSGYTFAGWDATIPDLMPAENLTINALWGVNSYTITFDTDGGSSVAAISQDYGTTITAPANPTKTGYTFAGWTQEIPTTMPAGNVTIKALWTINQYTITFNTNGGTEIPAITQDYGTVITKPADPKKDGCTFAGWNPTIPDLMPAENLTIDAVWGANKYTITFDTDGGTEIYPITKEYGAEVVAPEDPTKKGYTFAGWNPEIPATMPSEDVTIKAQWTINQYTITFKDGDKTLASITQDYGTTFDKPAVPTKKGYVFAGWDKEVPSTIPAENMTITAQWNKLYTISFDTDGGSEIASIISVAGAPITAPADPTKTGYTFKGWNPSLPSSMPSEDLTVKAQWQINQYTITFDSDGGTEVSPITKNYGTEVTPPTNPTKEGFFFGGWDPALPETMPAENMIVKAIWNSDESEYTITFNTDGGTVISPIKGTYGTTITAPDDPTKTGYTFAGWNPDIPSTMPAKNMTIKALWTINQYTITFNTDGGSAIPSITQDYGTNIITPGAPIKEGYSFTGWDKEVPTTMPAENITLTAQWKINEYAVNYYVDGELYKTVNYDYNADVTAEAEPTKTGYTFSGWSEIPSVMPAKDVTVTGTFSVNQYTITFNTDGGSAIPSITQNYGTTVIYPQIPTKKGYTFTSWDKEVPATMPAEDITLTAQWKINEYAVNYYVDGELYKTVNYNYNAEITAESEPTKTGYTFSGWSEIPTVMPAKDVTVTGSFSVNQYTITFNTDGGSAIPSITQNYGTTVNYPEIPTKEGYTFTGWDKDVPTTMPAEDMTITALWQINEYALTYYVDGELYKSAKYNYNAEVTAEAEPTKTGYTFSGWSEIPTVMPAKDVTVTGTFTINQYTITFDTDGGTEINPITQNYGTVIVAPENPIKEGYDFVGWTPEIPQTVPASDVVVQAIWGPKTVEDSYTFNNGWTWVSFNMYNGDDDMGNLNKVLSSCKWTSVDEIKGAGEWAIYSVKKNSWIGTLAGFQNATMYKVHSSYDDQQITISGPYLNSKGNRAISIEKGWNYLAYLPIGEMSVTDALQDYEAVEGDVVKSQTQSATYSNGSWNGDFTMEPGKGYMMFRNAEDATEFIYPIGDAEEEQSSRGLSFTAFDAQPYSSNMTVIAEVEGVMSVPGDSIVAYATDGVRGGATIDNEGKACLTIQGDSNTDVYLALMHNGDIVASANAPISYVSDDIRGSYANPTSITFTEGTASWDESLNVTAIYAMDGKKLPTTDVKTLSTGLYIIKYEVSDNNSNSGCRVLRIVR